MAFFNPIVFHKPYGKGYTAYATWEKIPHSTRAHGTTGSGAIREMYRRGYNKRDFTQTECALQNTGGNLPASLVCRNDHTDRLAMATAQRQRVAEKMIVHPKQIRRHRGKENDKD